MAKIDLSKFSAHIQQACNKALTELLSPDNTQPIADELAEQIRLRTRLGKSLDGDGGEPTPLKPLSEKYKKKRATYKGLSSSTTPNKSNLTLTGEMLDDVTGFAKPDGKISIYVKDEFSKKKAGWNAEKGRPFLFLSRVQIERLRNKLQAQITQLIKKYI